MAKLELRKIYLARQQGMAASERLERGRQIAGRFFDRFDLTKVKILHCFIPIARFNEIDTSLVYERIWADLPSVRTAAPRVNFITGGMENLVFMADTELAENEWGIREPVSGETVDAAEIDMVLVPLLCFDKEGHRVGYGKGFYDRFLGKCRSDCVKVGLSYFPPVTQITATDTHDVTLDFYVTPCDVFTFGKN